MDEPDMTQEAASSSPAEVLHATCLQHTAWDALLRQLAEVQRRMEQRLEAIDVELQYLETFRGGIASEVRSESSPRRRSVTVPSPREGGKRSRDEAPFVGYAMTSPRPRGEVGALGLDPFREAGLYTISNNPVVRVAPLSLSRDEKARQEVEYILPSYIPVGVARAKGLPSAGAARLFESLSAAGLDKRDFALSSTSVGRCLSVHIPPNTSDVQALCAEVPEELVRALCRDSMGDPGVIASCLYTELAQQATLHALILPAMRLRSVTLLRLPPYRQQLLLEATMWTLRKCCDCRDRDLTENSHVRWCKVLQSAAPETQACANLKRNAYATGYSQLLHGLNVVSSVRQGYLVAVLTVCGNFFDLLDAGNVPLQRRTSPFLFRGAHVAPNGGQASPSPAVCS
ncbi:conserved hypothetical protein [Leishmania mexicana MHOM/GT/2001/U1103]|uniref:Uncharacterized protein n=1 Tax=Leishmania mexicana (strain MHOM/GT/2001/U1103) TaxID=929439 RepID=E9AQG3_LEIMU|nr:conserved hypothetical protein [Leishmania mexicana MHOM/GT/2001/U1103]CBZ25182.1 conserved hypothetical protein [Leishmania mexicana MHOM/GT/2001/U1103]